MNKKDLLKSIAEKGYDVGLGAKKHFATYDIVEKTPGWISFISLAFGIIFLVVKGLSTELTSVIFIIFGVVSLYIGFYEHKKKEYDTAGKELTKIFHELKYLYLEVKSLEEKENFSNYLKQMTEIESRYYSCCISKQIVFSNWYAHYKFFWEHQIKWIDEQLNFKFWRDKIPLSLSCTILILIVTLCYWSFNILSYICTASNL